MLRDKLKKQQGAQCLKRRITDC